MFDLFDVYGSALDRNIKYSKNRTLLEQMHMKGHYTCK